MRFPPFCLLLPGKSPNKAVAKKSARRLNPEVGAPRIERLEARIALSVTVKVANNNIFISGDGADNHVAVFQDAIRRLFIYGDTATAIAGDGTVAGAIADTNAGGGREFDPGQFTNIYINMGAGSDDVEIAGLQSTDVGLLSINTGDGGDSVTVSQSTFAGSPDIFFGFNATTGPVTITSGNGANHVSVNALTAPSLAVTTGAGIDTINIAINDDVSINAGDLLINTGDGTNSVLFGPNHNTAVTGQLSLHTGANNDTITIDSVIANSLVAQTGAGTDAITLSSNVGNTIHGDATLGGGAGAKTFTVGSANNKPTTIDGSFNIVTEGDSNLVTLNFLQVGNTRGSLGISAPTGNATVTLASLGDVNVVNGSASIDTGDVNTPNAVSIGSSHSVLVSGDLSVHTGAGADTVTLDSLTTSGLSVNTGDGTDGINVAQSGAVTVHGDAILQGGAAKKTILVGSTNHPTVIDGDMAITLGAGSDAVTLDFLTVGNVQGSLNISTGLGDDVVKLAAAGDVSVPHGSVTIDAGDASTIDSVTIGSANHAVTISGDLAIHTGSGDDAVILDSLTVGSTLGSLTIDTGTGGDTITLAGNGNITVAHGSVSIDTGDGISDAVLIGVQTTV